MEKEEYEAQIKALKEEIELLKKKQTYEIKRQKYGLNWIDVPEAFEKDSENKIPVLEEVKEKSIKNNDGKPTHILIEGDNYHALQCLNYTHKGKVDVIYIDPPYNTGKEFVYKDARFLDKYPDGSLVDSNHPLKHSYWLSFMEKRLKLAKNLLSDKGVIFISIDDYEQANLKLLCDSIFGGNNFVNNFIITSAPAGTQSAVNVSIQHSYCLCYSKNYSKINFILSRNKDELESRYSEKDNLGLFYSERLWKRGIGGRKEDVPTLHFPVYFNPNTNEILIDEEFKNQENFIKIIPYQTVGVLGRWTWSKEKMKSERYKLLVKKVAGEYKLHKKVYLAEEKGKLPYSIIGADIGRTELGGLEVKEIFGGQKLFSYPKPTQLITHFISMSSTPSSTILDFFAGSGTTLHATMKLNEEDGGNRQCILVQLNENNICEEVTYERNRRVMQGYTNSKGEQIPGLGNSLKYYKTAFIGQNNCKNANDDDRTELAKKAGCLLSLGENTLDEICSTEYYQLFTGSKEATAVYFTDDYEKFDEFKEKVAELAPKFKKTFVYIFAWSSADDFAYEFEDIPNIQIKAIPLPILEIYKSIYNG